MPFNAPHVANGFVAREAWQFTDVNQHQDRDKAYSFVPLKWTSWPFLWQHCYQDQDQVCVHKCITEKEKPVKKQRGAICLRWLKSAGGLAVHRKRTYK